MTLVKMPQRARVRDVLPKLDLGRWSPGRLNSITDVPGVLVHTESIQPNQDVNTGVTTILPRSDWYKYSSFAGIFRFNGCGEMTGSHWIDDSGLLTSPIVLTSTSAIGDAYRGILNWVKKNHSDETGTMDLFVFPLVAETFDGFLSHHGRFAVTPEHVVRGMKLASSDRVDEGNTGGGTGMICHRFKGGTGSSSRVIHGIDLEGNKKEYTVGVLVQANYGARDTLHVGGVPIGRILGEQKTGASAAGITQPEKSTTLAEQRKDGSIIIVIATDVPLHPLQLQRLARRASVGLGKVGGYGNNSSGDIFLAFSTGNAIPVSSFSMSKPSPVEPYKPYPRTVQMIDDESINGVYEGAADATEEAIYNALCMAETMTGFQGRIIEALDLEALKEIMEKKL